MSDHPENIGFIGIGNMGWWMATNLAKRDFAVTVFDTDPKKAEQLASEAAGIVPAKSIAELAACSVVITMLPSGPIVRAALFEGGNEALASLLKPGSIVIDMSSSEPVGTQQLGQMLARHGVALVDAPVSGGVARAKTATLAIMYGSDDPIAVERIQPILKGMGDRLFPTGALGNGHAMKALNNFVAASAFAATSEALLIGERFGLDPATMVDILNVSTGRSFHTDVTMKEHVVNGKYATGFSVGLLAKDVRIAAGLAAEVGQHAPVLGLISDRWNYASDTLGATRDNSEAHRAWKEQK